MKKHVMYVLNRSGHSPLVQWAPDNKVDIKGAKEMFGELKEKGYHFFDATDKQDSSGELTKFKPEAKEIVAFRQMEGG